MAIQAKPYGLLPDGQAVTQYTMTNRIGASVSVIDFGAIFTSIVVPDRDGKLEDVALGFDNLEAYRGDHSCMGDTVGRYGNRIAGGRFTLDGVTYKLALNDGENHLHGGYVGFAAKLWTAEPKEGQGADSLILRLTSPDGEEHYPGTLKVTLTCTWDDDCRLTLHYQAVTDKPTLCNLTNHTYFNLGGHAHGTIRDHVLTLESDATTAVGKGLIPTGELSDVTGTPFDLRAGKLLGEGLDQTDAFPPMALAGGYDHNFVLRKGEAMGLAAHLVHPESGRTMDVLTDQPGVQLYTACSTDAPGGKDGAHYGRYSGLCLETQHYPDSPNHPQFPSTTLRPGETYDTTTVYAFGTV